MIRFPCWFTFPSSFKLFLTSKHTIRPFIKVRFQLLFVHKLKTRPTKENSDAYFNLLSDTTDSLLLKNKILCLERIPRWPKSFFFPPFFSTYRIDMNEEVSRRSIIVPMGPFSRQIKQEFYQVLLWAKRLMDVFEELMIINIIKFQLKILWSIRNEKEWKFIHLVSK